FAKEVQQARRPTLKSLKANLIGAIFRTPRLSSLDIDAVCAIKLPHTDTGLSRAVPRGNGSWAIHVRKVTAFGAHLHLADTRRRGEWRYGFIGAFVIQGVDNAEEQRRGRIHTNEAGIALSFEVADPNCQHIGSCNTHRPCVSKPPRRSGFPCHRPAPA